MVEEVRDYAILLLDIDGNVLTWNPGAEQIKGYSEQEIRGKNFTIFYPEEDRERGLPQQLLKEAFENGRASHEGWRIRKDGSRFWGSIVITALHDDDGKVGGFSKLTRDLTQKKQSEDFILLQNRQLEEFAYVASHDLQEPLRKITIFSNLLEENLENPRLAREYISKINHSTQRMAKLIKGVLDYSRAKTTPEQFEEIDLNNVVDEIRNDFELLLAERGGKITSGKLPSVNGIPIQMHQLFANIVSNAIKFSEKNPEITIVSENTDDSSGKFARIRISDNGIGFNPENADKIFKMFLRLNTENPGTGIGLALCKRIVENHGGAISATSIPGKGSAFEIMLPLN